MGSQNQRRNVPVVGETLTITWVRRTENQKPGVACQVGGASDPTRRNLIEQFWRTWRITYVLGLEAKANLGRYTSLRTEPRGKRRVTQRPRAQSERYGRLSLLHSLVRPWPSDSFGGKRDDAALSHVLSG